MPSMKSFAKAFFTSFGARLQAQGDEWIVDLPPNLVDIFDKPRLYLVFPQEEARELSPTEDLLVYGSRTFEQMLALLESRGEATCLHWPGQVEPGSDHDLPVSPLPLANSRVVSGQVHSDHEPFYIFNFRVVYLSDEKQEVFITIALDAKGQATPGVINRLAEAGALQPGQALMDSVQVEAPRQMLERAESVARRQIDDRAAQLESEIRPRLEKALLRLTGYYRRLLDEVDTGDAAQDEAVRADLRQDLSRKIGDELERHQLRVTLTPLSYAIALAPFAYYRLKLATAHTHQNIALKQNLHTGQVIEPSICEHCREPLDYLALCDRQHLVHDHCLDTCRRCERDICLACGIQACAICAASVCVDCVAACAYCQNWLCADHLSPCAICGIVHCPDHAAHCRWCGQSYCHQCVAGQACDTCRQALASTETPTLPPVSEAELSRYQWSYAKNRAFGVYIGRSTGPISPLRSWLIVVTGPDGNMLHQHTLGPWQRFLLNR